jgi:hypothetical protein
MAFIFQENLDSQVNGSQTVFTLTNNISLITDVIFDGGPYIGTTTVTGFKQITLGDAPTVSLRVSYYTSAPTGTSDLILVSDAIARFQLYRNDALGEISNDLYFAWLSELNYFMYDYLIKSDPSRYINEVPLTITEGTAAYSLPSDFSDNGLSVRGCGIFKNDATTNAVTSARIIESGEGSIYEGYYLQLGAFVITPEPYTTSNVTMRYIPKILPITALSESLYIDIKYMELVMNYLDKSYSQWNNDADRENAADLRFQRNLSRLLSNFARTPKIVRFK